MTMLVIVALLAAAQSGPLTGTVIYDYPADPGVTAADVTLYNATLYVNDTALPLNDLCVLVTSETPNVIRCTASLPSTVANTLTPSGPQTFQVTLKHGILEGTKSTPVVLQRLSAVSNVRIQ